MSVIAIIIIPLLQRLEPSGNTESMGPQSLAEPLNITVFFLGSVPSPYSDWPTNL